VLAHRARTALGEEIEERLEREVGGIAQEGMTVPVDDRQAGQDDGPLGAQDVNRRLVVTTDGRLAG